MSLQRVFNNHGYNFDDVSKIEFPGLLRIQIFQNKGYDVIIPDYDVTNKILSRESNYNVDAVMWPKFGNCSVLWLKLSQLQFYKDLTWKTAFFEEWSWFKFNNLRMALDMTSKFYTSVAKELKLKVRRFWGLISTFAKVTGEKLVGRLLSSPHPE